MIAGKLDWLARLKNAELTAIATAVGVNCTGTKPILQQRLQQCLPESVFTGKSRKVVSIDMGIRNLAMCTFDFRRPAKPHVLDWKRINVSAETESAPFEPQVYAQHAYDLVAQLVQQAPGHVLIERQRFRSMGGSAVQEWTLRVNMFESMLYACLTTLRNQDRWPGCVWGVSPAKVARYWIKEDDSESKLSKSARGKKAKVDLVGSWLQDGTMFTLSEQAASTKDAYVRKFTGQSRGDAFGKLDDLADSLLQGMAWYQWEQNRQRLMSGASTSTSTTDLVSRFCRQDLEADLSADL